ncbi:unnamed protein product [Haemonchus placei]|uniref:Integrase_H2C2 domain-containing protein n=1 Tax=Haemonchus placei TaxID=6290 RepID=A0A0N4W7I2_HAEPC|nr:unnamed protein product [Haemonchus placei]
MEFSPKNMIQDNCRSTRASNSKALRKLVTVSQPCFTFTIPKACFSRFVRHIGNKHVPSSRTFKWSGAAVEAVQKVVLFCRKVG